MKDNSFFKAIGKYWWMPLVTGIIYIALGIWTFLCPMEGIAMLAYFFAAFMLFSGFLNMTYTYKSGGMSHGWGWNLAVGILEVIAGFWLLCLSPAVIATAFAYVVGIWIVAVAVMAFCEAFMMRSWSVGSIIWMILAAIVTAALAIIFLSSPIAGGVVVWIWLGLALVGYGCYKCISAFQLRKLYKTKSDR